MQHRDGALYSTPVISCPCNIQVLIMHIIIVYLRMILVLKQMDSGFIEETLPITGMIDYFM